MGTEDDHVSEDAGTITTADIDANGNGSMSIETLPKARRNMRSGERLVLENSVQWSGAWRYSDDYNYGQVFDSKISVDGDMRRLVEEASGSWIGFYSGRWETTVDVTGQLIEGTGFCKVASGTITESYVTNEGATSEYYARALSMHMIRYGYQNLMSENDYFFCDFVDL